MARIIPIDETESWGTVSLILESGFDGVLIPPGTPLNPETMRYVRMAMAIYPELNHDVYRRHFYPYEPYELVAEHDVDEDIREWYLQYRAKILADGRAFYLSQQDRLRNRKTKPKPHSLAEGFVYLLKTPQGLYKIGRSKNAEKRITKLGVKLPYPIYPLAIIKTSDMVALEKVLHARFEEKRVNGEWFELSDEDVQYIKSLEE